MSAEVALRCYFRESTVSLQAYNCCPTEPILPVFSPLCHKDTLNTSNNTKIMTLLFWHINCSPFISVTLLHIQTELPSKQALFTKDGKALASTYNLFAKSWHQWSPEYWELLLNYLNTVLFSCIINLKQTAVDRRMLLCYSHHVLPITTIKSSNWGDLAQAAEEVNGTSNHHHRG